MPSNETTFFIIRGITDDPQFQIIIFCLVLFIYLTTIAGNLTFLSLVCFDHHLHTPMYIFLGNLSVVDMLCSTITQHNVLLSFITKDKSIGYGSCMAQMYMFGSLTGQELLILTAMGYDRYVAICRPLLYYNIMNKRTCVLLNGACWIWGFLQIMPPLGVFYTFTCYSSRVINHFFCDILPLMKLSCNDISLLRIFFFMECLVLIGCTPFFLTFISYIFIIRNIMKIRSTTGKRKAFYTCSSHLTVVLLLYTTLFSQYMSPDLNDSTKLFALFNTAAVPLLNPLIYSLKNKDVKAALRQSLVRLK
ncbi:olfactory receptor 6C74-like [Dendropsophus ebraccatus]|uniref:olfactory receptor 6C74-like n=1 Tax=Dendropsophus ebraccatus TaxID=150705 RepID=UPI003831E133